jgi:Arc/MetJ-type ribon-helix-helix transcriptional regulator
MANERASPYISQAKRPNKQEYIRNLIKKIEGKPQEQWGEILTLQQWDTLIDAGIDLDNFTVEQQKIVSELSKVEREIGKTYNKKYSPEKQAIYTSIVDCLKAQKAEILPLIKENYRDLVFNLNGETYQIVFSKGGKTAKNLIKN